MNLVNEKTWTVSWTGHLRDACCHTRFGRNSGRTAECNNLDDGDYEEDEDENNKEEDDEDEER